MALHFDGVRIADDGYLTEITRTVFDCTVRCCSCSRTECEVQSNVDVVETYNVGAV